MEPRSDGLVGGGKDRVLPALRILMVDDQVEDFVVVRHLLKTLSAGYRISHVETPEEAENALARSGFDLALIDHNLGDRKGVELIGRLRDQERMIPLILLTGMNDPELSMRALDAGASDFLDKSELSARNLERCLRYAFRQYQVENRLRRSEMEMRKAMEMAELASAAKSLFLARVSHELRTPLNAIIGFSELMQEQIFGDLGNERYVEYSGNILEAGQHLLNLVNDILDLSKVESGRAAYHPVRVPIRLLISDVLRLTKVTFRKAGVSLSSDVPQGFDVIVDRRAFRQVLLNLLSNACKFTRAGGAVTLSVAAHDDTLHLSVQDNGAGIPAAKMSQIMEPFVQANQDRFVAEEGTGLGLAIVKAILDAHGAWLDLQSTEGTGTTATVVLPTELFVETSARR